MSVSEFEGENRNELRNDCLLQNNASQDAEYKILQKAHHGLVEEFRAQDNEIFRLGKLLLEAADALDTCNIAEDYNPSDKCRTEALKIQEKI